MFGSITRRGFVETGLKAGAIAGIGDLAFLNGLRPVSAKDVAAASKIVQFSPDIEPLVRLIEDTPREKLLDAVAGKIHGNVSYQEVLAALLLAGVRNVQPRPVGFKFHAVLVVNSAHLASMAGPDSDRWLPLFWALDYFKGSQARDKEEGDWTMAAVDEAKLPPSHQAKERFLAAMNQWDEPGADVAIASMVRSAGAEEIMELFWRLGARDFRDIGHKAIYAANAWRTLQTIGWRHAEPVMRSLAYALLEHRESGNPGSNDFAADRPWRENIERAAKIRKGWQKGNVDPKAAAEVLATLRTASASDGSAHGIEMLNKQVDPSCLWDGVFLMAGELLMRQPGIVGIHCVTTANALHYAYETSGNDETRQMMLLQAMAFLPLFREAMKGRGKLRDDIFLDKLEPVELKSAGPEAVEEIFADLSKNKQLAAQKTLAALSQDKADPQTLLTVARRLIFQKGFDSHDYKFSSAALEDFYNASPAWRNQFLASSMFNLHGSGDRDNQLIDRARSALGA